LRTHAYGPAAGIVTEPRGAVSASLEAVFLTEAGALLCDCGYRGLET